MFHKETAMPALWQISAATVVVDHLHVLHAYSGIHLWLVFCDIDIANKGRQAHYFSFFMCGGQENTMKPLSANYVQLSHVTFLDATPAGSDFLWSSSYCIKFTLWQQMHQTLEVSYLHFECLLTVSRVPSFLHRLMGLFFLSLLEFIIKLVWSLKVSNPSQAQAG